MNTERARNFLDIEETLNERLSRWTQKWNQEGADQARALAVEFLSHWRDQPGDWFTDVSERFFGLSSSLDYREFQWEADFAGELQKLLFANHTLWHFEDEVRRDDIEPKEIVELKRGIDAVNQQRNNQMECLDEYVLARIQPSQGEEVPLQSEPPGLILDRLSIMSLKQFHYRLQGKQQEVEILDEQRNDLEAAFFQLLVDLQKGSRRVKVYRQLKTYNDPESNPAMNDE